MGELGERKIPRSIEKIVKEQDSQKEIEGKKIDPSEEEEKRKVEIADAYGKNRKKFENFEKIRDEKEKRKSLIKSSEEIVSKLPMIEPGSLERILKEVIKEYEPKERKYGAEEKEYDPHLGLIISSIINRTADYAGAKYPDNGDLKISLNTSRLEKPLNFLSYGNRRNVQQVIIGNVGDYLGFKAEGGRITVAGDAGKETGRDKRGGEILVIGNVKGWGEKPEDKGTIWQVSPRIGNNEKQEK